MGAFDHVVVLLSFIYALALTHLLSRIAGLLLARERVKFSGLLALCAANAIALVFANWLSLWDFVCAMAAPESTDEGPIDMEAFYWRNHRLFYSLMAACMVLALAANFAFLQTPTPALFFKENAITLVFFVPAVLPLAVGARWAQWAGGGGFLLMTCIYLALFSSTLK
jgi:hypothetical protein